MVNISIRNKKGAIELSIGTIVILVIAMSMLILGLILVRTIFTGAKYNVEIMNTKVQNEINKLFVEDKKVVIYLANQKLDIKQGEDWGVAFGIKNLIKGVTGSSEFEYEVGIYSPNTKVSNCGELTVKEALSWIEVGSYGSMNMNPGETQYDIIRFVIPEGAPLCFIRYTILVKWPQNNPNYGANSYYVTENFDVNIMG